ILEGTTSVAEAAFTGESKPVSKCPGARVLAGSDNLDGKIVVRATEAYTDFVISRISRLYQESTSYKPGFSMAADIAARYFVAFILIIAAVSAFGWYLAGSPAWFSIGLAVLVVSCPCALSLATPVAYTVAISAMRNHGIVIGNGAFLERLCNIGGVVFDKTGTLTTGKLRIAQIAMVANLDKDAALEIAAALEIESKHPIARSFERQTSKVASNLSVVPGEGVQGEIEGITYRLGKSGFAAGRDVAEPDGEGSWILLASEMPLAWFLLVDEVREEAADVVGALASDYSVAMFTGDNAREGRRLGERVGIEDVRPLMTPADKVAGVRALQAQGDRILMVGDGINDAAALAAASASISVSPADIVVQEAADATLLHADLRNIPLAIRFAHRVRSVIRQNIAWAVLYNIVVIPLAVAGLVEPWMAALGMSASSVAVVLNANRLHKVA
ncbi:MAG TPA: heavy metal translocating P-type ATPase, partial [Pseudomonadales bacterium]|nr:heavy metal translocating P-type ATPase [Pseudomonadales bacterium]